MPSIPSVRIFASVAFEKVQLLVLIDDGPVSSFGRRSSNASSSHASLLQTIDRSIDRSIDSVPTYSVSISSTLQIFRDANHL